MEFLERWAIDTWAVTLDAAPWLLAGFFLAGVAHVLLPTKRVVAHLGGAGIGGVLKAALIGVPLPLCSCSVIPVAAGLRRQGASRGATASFLISTPESGVDSIAVSYALLGPFLAIVRPIAAFLTATVAGVLVGFYERSGFSRDAAGDGAEASGAACDSGDACCGCGDDAAAEVDQRRSLAAKFGRAVHYGFVEMFVDLSHWLAIGFLAAGLLTAVLPDDLLERSMGGGVWGLLAMLLAGLPLYVCATSATPVAAALIAKGLSPGAALVFLLVGPATNVATMVVVGRELGRASLAIYLASIALVAIVLGLVVDVIAQRWPTVVSSGEVYAEHAPDAFSTVCAIVLCVLLANAFRLQITSKLES